MEFNDMLAPKPLHLPEDPAQNDRDALRHPDSPLAWAELAERELDKDTPEKLVAYAFARTGYHRGLDRLRGNGWKGWGPVPFEHEPNQGVLRAIAALGRAAKLIGEDDEYDRIEQMLNDADADATQPLLTGRVQ